MTGSREAEREERRRAADFVRRAGVARLEPVARWIVPVCPRTIGVEADVAAIIDTRIREVAAAAGAPVAKAGCSANIAVVFTADGAGLARAMLAKAPDLLAELPRPERERVLDGDGPIRWWYNVRIETRDGMPANQGIVKHYNSSVVSTQVVRALRTALVIVDVEKADGTPLDAVASYAAMVALAEIRDNPPPPRDSIMELFTAEGGRRDLSDRDSALLRGVYSVPPDREAFQHRRQLVGAVRQDRD